VLGSTRKELMKYSSALQDFWFDVEGQPSLDESDGPNELPVENEKPPLWSKRDIVFGVAIDKPGVLAAVIEGLRWRFVGIDEVKVLSWALCELSGSLNSFDRRRLEDAFGERLMSADVSPEVAATMISTLRMLSETDRYGAFIVRYLQNVHNSAEHVEGIVEGLDYLSEFTRQDAQEVCQQLQTYPHRSEVRRRAKSLRGRLVN
jgi:hypothetical protein